MTVALASPALHSLDCRDCLRYVYDPSRNWEPAPPRNGERMRRRGDPPCKQCAKQSPALAWLYELSPANIEAVRHWQRHRAMNFNGMTETERADDIVGQNFAIIDSVYRAHEATARQDDALLAVQAAMQIALTTPPAQQRGPRT